MRHYISEKVDFWWNDIQQGTHELSTPKHGEKSMTATKYPCNICGKLFTHVKAQHLVKIINNPLSNYDFCRY